MTALEFITSRLKLQPRVAVVLGSGLGAFAEILTETDLVVLIGKPLDFTLRFGETPTLSSSCKWAAPATDALISSHHAVLVRDGRDLILRDKANLQLARDRGGAGFVQHLVVVKQPEAQAGIRIGWCHHLRTSK